MPPLRRSTAAALAPAALLGALLGALLAAPPPAAAHGKAHVHGVVRLDVAVDGAQLTVALEAPLDSLVGFERRPRTDAERRAAAAALAKLRDAASWLKPDAAAGCTLEGADVRAGVLDPAAPPAAAESDHADLEAEVAFRCAAADRLQALEVGLFAAFARIERIEVQVAGAAGQSKQTLRRPAKSVRVR